MSQVNTPYEEFVTPGRTLMSPKASSFNKKLIIGVLITIGLVFIAGIGIFCAYSSTHEKAKADGIYPHYNPYFVQSYEKESKKVTKIILKNERKRLEKNQAYIRNYVPIVKETYENPEPKLLQVLVMEYDEHMARLMYLDTELPRWQVPYYGNSSDPYGEASKFTHNPNGFQLHNDVSGSFQWSYRTQFDYEKPLLDTRACRLQYFDKYLEFETHIDSSLLSGMGERVESFILKNDNYTLWNKFNVRSSNLNNGHGLSGSHPFVFGRIDSSKKQNFVGLFMRNSNAMLFSKWGMNEKTFINYKMIGGIIDLYIFHSADAQHILRKYHSVIGRPYLPALWAMGYHQAREGYTVKDYKEIIRKHESYNIPIDALWADGTMNEDRKTFTVNNYNFAGIKELVEQMHDEKKGINMKFVAIANPGIKKDTDYRYYNEAIKEGVFIRSATRLDEPFEGQTVAGVTIWLDFFAYGAVRLWANGLFDLRDKTLFDGIWISDNEIYQLCDGECSTRETNADMAMGPPNPFHNASEFKYLQYRPTVDPLDTNTLPMTAYHQGDELFHKQYFTHNLFGLQISQATFNGLAGIFGDKRYFIASRSTWPGSGQYASHWLDSNFATWESMSSSIPSMLRFNLFGIPHVGAPIGGHYFNVTAELFRSWFALGAFSPLMLSYSSASANGKEAYAFPDEIWKINAALTLRYQLLRFMYTKMFEAHLWGGAVIHPMYFSFPNDKHLYEREIVDTTFMWGDSLYIVPNLIRNREELRAYLPNWNWYCLHSYEMINQYSPFVDGGRYFEFEIPKGPANAFIKGGSIIPQYSQFAAKSITNTKGLDSHPLHLLVAPDHNFEASGTYVVDSENIRPYPDPNSNTYRHYSFTYKNQVLRFNKLAGFDFKIDKEYDSVVEISILNYDLKKVPRFACMINSKLEASSLGLLMSVAGNVVHIHDKNLKPIPLNDIESIVIGSETDENPCKPQVHIDSMKLSNEDRVLDGTLRFSDEEASKEKFDFRAIALNDKIVGLSIAKYDAQHRQWSVPDVINDYIKRNPTGNNSLADVGFTTSKLHEPFHFAMSNPKDPNDFLISTKNQPFAYLKNFIRTKFLISSQHIFGLGERTGKFELADGHYSLWNHDSTKEGEGSNSYSSHPFYMFHTNNPQYFAGVFFLTSNPMELIVKHSGIRTEIDHILSGGILEVYFFGKGTADEVLRNYHYLIGKPALLPFWAFGYHFSRSGYKNIEQLKLAVQRLEGRNIPVDGVWLTREYMSDAKSFTIDETNWSGLKEYVQTLKGKGKHFVPVVDAGIAKVGNYDVYEQGLQNGIFLKEHSTGKPSTGITWAGYSVWIDFVHPGTNKFWDNTLSNFHRLVEYDGVWLDMNEPTSFCDGECSDQINYRYFSFPLDHYADLIYMPTQKPLGLKTLSLNAVHYGDPMIANEFNYHSMYNYYQSKLTAYYFRDKRHQRPLIVSRSTFPGSGRFAGHWLGNNYASWESMEQSISGILSFNMFGIPFVGANICGNMGNATEELCARWMQLGAFYPFMRRYDTIKDDNQDSELLSSVSRKAILTRYSLLRYIYSTYMNTALKGGAMIKPLIFEFPKDDETYTTIDKSFMLGSALHIAPILDSGKDSIVTYFPNANWYTYNAPSYLKVLSYDRSSQKGKHITIVNPLSNAQGSVYIKHGTIFPRQEVTEGITSVNQLHDMPITLIVTPDQNLEAKGEIYYDTEKLSNFQNILMKLTKKEITFKPDTKKENIDYKHKDSFISKIVILEAGDYRRIKSAKYENNDGTIVDMKTPVYNSVFNTLTLEPVHSDAMSILELSKVTLS